MNDYLSTGDFNKELVDKIRSVITENCKSNPYMWAKNQSVFNELPVKQRYKLCMNFNDQLLKQFSFFNTCTDLEFIVKIVPLLKFLKLQYKDLLWAQGESPDASTDPHTYTIDSPLPTR